MNWHKYPFLRLLLPLALGIGISEAFPGFRPMTMVVHGMILAAFTIFLVLHRAINDYRNRWVIGIDMMIVFALIGFLLARLHAPEPIVEGQGVYLARVYDPPVEKGKTVKVMLEIEGLHSDTGTVKSNGRLIAYLEKTEEALALSYGEMISFSAHVDPVPPPLNPQEFDYRTYLHRQGVAGRVYLKQDEWMPVGVNHGNPIFSFAYRFRDHLLDALKRNGITEDEFGAGAAILLGYDESLPAQLRQHYVAAGSMHILCVSGMHVGIIYLLASFVLGFIGKGKKMVKVRSVLLLVLIWFYALLTGLSPSILRSTLMISMVILGELTRRKGVILNSIAASAFIILLINPNDLFSIGFQLSYAAVVGIVLLQRPIYLLFYIKNKLFDKVWEITAVSIAAQIATMPFTVFYFKQFTPYFWLSNLPMTPLSFIVILSGMLLLLVSWVPGLSALVGKMVWACLRVMNVTVAGIDHLPFSLVKGLFINRFEFAMALLLLLLLYLIINIRKKRFLMEMVVVGLVFAGSLAVRAHQTVNRTELLFYSMKNHTAIDFIQGSQHLLLCDEQLLNDNSSIDYSLKGSWSQKQLSMNPPCYTLVDDVDTELVLKCGPLLSFQGKLMAIVGPSLVLDTSAQSIDVDILMVTGKQRARLSEVVKVYRPSLLLVDGSVPNYYVGDWKSQAADLNLPFCCLGDGYYKYLIINE